MTFSLILAKIFEHENKANSISYPLPLGLHSSERAECKIRRDHRDQEWDHERTLL